MSATASSAPTQFLQTSGEKYAYRRFGGGPVRISRKEGHRFTASRSMVSRHVGPLLVKQDVLDFPS
jgi:hypothetical protein